MRFLLLCLLSTGNVPEAGAAAFEDPWREVVVARIQDGRRVLLADGPVWAAESPEAGLRAELTTRGVVLSGYGATLGVRTAKWGCPGKLGGVQPASVHAGGEIRTTGLTELWTSTPEGFEQRWKVDAAPACDGDLVLEVAISGASASGESSGLRLEGDDGAAWLVRRFAAWDAKGTPLDLRAEPTAEGFRLRVQAAQARYPLIIDPIYSVAATVLEGEAGGDRFGYDVSGAGDVDGDGFDDVVVGASHYDDDDVADTGRAYVYLGSAEGITTAEVITLTGESAYDHFGYSVSGAGDIDGDGFGDVIVGAIGHDAGRYGHAYMFPGSAEGLSLTAAATLDGPESSARFGREMGAAGDVNGDGYSDVIIAGDGNWGYYGAFVYEGSDGGLVSSPVGFTDEGQHDFGNAVSGAGDINGDGYDDVLVGAQCYQDDPTLDCQGRVYVFLGSEAGVSSEAAFVLTGETEDSFLGAAASGVGDVDSDGYDDIVVGAPLYDDLGRAYVLRGSPDGVALSDAITIDGEVRSLGFGLGVSGAGDVDGDGHDDIFIGAYPRDDDLMGRAYLFLGSPDGVSLTAASTLTGEAELDYYGSSLSGAGDVNGNGLDDLIVGTMYYSSPGRAYVYLDSGDTDGDGYMSVDDCDDTDDTLHPGAEEVACDCLDQDCDGADLQESCDTAYACGDTAGTADTADTASNEDSAVDSGRDDTDPTDSGPSTTDTGPTKDAPACGCSAAPPTAATPALALVLALAQRHPRSRSASASRKR